MIPPPAAVAVETKVDSLQCDHHQKEHRETNHLRQ